MTSSPVTPGGHGVPSGAYASSAHPSSRALISPARTGVIGVEPTNAVHTSVPPLIDDTGTPTRSCTQRKPAAGRGAPVDPTQRSEPRAGRTSALRHVIRNGADTPSTVVRVSSASDHSV